MSHTPWLQRLTGPRCAYNDRLLNSLTVANRATPIPQLEEGT
jgi:hypothetical protein